VLERVNDSDSLGTWTPLLNNWTSARFKILSFEKRLLMTTIEAAVGDSVLVVLGVTVGLMLGKADVGTAVGKAVGFNEGTTDDGVAVGC
jgi:hypothetical protein